MKQLTRAFLPVLFTGFCAAQEWLPLRSQPRYRFAANMAIDPRDGRATLFGGYLHRWQIPDAPLTDDFWKWADSGWQLLGGATPPARVYPAMATDLLRGRLLLFGGEDQFGNALRDTWEWDGATWTQFSPTTRPPVFLGPPVMVCDFNRSRAVLYGSTNVPVSSTWEWDGSNWTQTGPGTPPARLLPSMAFDWRRSRVVMFGGLQGGRAPVFSNETWEYDGTQWQQSLVGGPAGRYCAAMAYDVGRQRTVLFGGTNGNADFADTWEFDGAAWSSSNPPVAPPAQNCAAMAYDLARARVVLFGRRPSSGGTCAPSTWEYDGAQWLEQATPAAPPARILHTFGADAVPGRQLLFGGARDGGVTTALSLGDTWLFDGSRWQAVAAAVAPPARANHAVALDTARRRAVLFGGNADLTVFGDTWEWDGTAWSQRQPAQSPPARFAHAMAFDAARGNTLLYGGADFSQTMGDAWLWDGSNWSSVLASGPGLRAQHGMVWDGNRQVVSMFGGALQNDLWEWNGVAWSQRPGGATLPPPRSGHAMVHDPVRARTIVHGGLSFLSQANSWEWNGAAGAWLQTVSDTPLRTSAGGTAAYDPLRQRVLLFDGFELWSYSYLPSAASAFGHGCAGLAGVPALAAMGRPFQGNHGFHAETRNCRTAAPAVLCASFASTSVALPGGCTLYLQQPLVVAIGVCDAAGTFDLSLPIPATAAARGVSFVVQTAAIDAQAPLGLVLANALQLLIGD